MKKLLLIIFLISGICSAQNRVATLLDVAKYGTYITVGDLILDKPTNGVPFADGINQLRYTSISKSFPTLRENATLWIDGTKIGPLCEIRFLNVNETTPWLITTATIKPIPGTRVNGIVTKNSYGGFLYLVQGLKFLTIDGESEAYPGLKGLDGKSFVKGRFGFGATSTGYYGGYHMYSISVLNGGKLVIKGFEGEHGFSVLRVNGGSYDWTVSLEVSNFYIHDSGSEGQYLGATHGPPYAKLKDLQIHDGIIARSGSESLQLQHLIGKAWIHNVTMFACDAGYLNEFQPYQDTGLQISPDEGDIRIENLVIDSWGSRAITCFGAPSDSPNKLTTFRKILMIHGRAEAIYKHPSADLYGMNFKLDSLYILNLNSDYYIGNKAANPSWIVNTTSTDKFSLTNVFYKDQPEVDYVNSGFHETADKVKYYAKTRGKYLSGLDSALVEYYPGEILPDREPLKDQVFVKVINRFTASNVRPKNNPNCQILTWDSNTVRSDQPGWCSTCIQKPYPPDDLQVTANSYYGKLNIGFVEERPSYETLLTTIEEMKNTISEQARLYQESQATITELNKFLAATTAELNATIERTNALKAELKETLIKYQ